MLRVFDQDKLLKGEEAAAVQTFVASMVAHVKRRYVEQHGLPELVFHYTSQFGFKGIIQSGVLRATHLAYTNDSSEYQHAVTLLLEAVKKARNKSSNKLECVLLDCMEPQLGILDPEDYPRVFVACFSAVCDSLTQWRNYGGGEGGLAIGWDRAGIELSLRGLNAAFGPVLYDEDAKRSMLDAAVAWGLDTFRTKAATKDPTNLAKYAEQWTETFFAFASQFAPFFKNMAFAEEREWRILYGPQYRSEVKVIEKNLALTSFVDLRLGKKASIPPSWSSGDPGRKEQLPDHLPIRDVWFGPSRGQALTNLSAKILVENAGYPAPINLRRSKAPFRSV